MEENTLFLHLILSLVTFLDVVPRDKLLVTQHVVFLNVILFLVGNV
jgi:hypothetical protein